MVRRILMAYLSLTRGERNGFFILSLLIILLLAGRFLIPVLVERPIPDFRENEKAFLAFRSAYLETLTATEDEKTYAGREPGSGQHPSRADIQYFHFDPNYITYGELKKLGLSERVVRTLIRYRNSGGKFQTKQDLMKVYGLEIADFQRLEPYIDIAKVPVPVKKERHTPAIELNGTDSLQLQEVFGIGPVFAKRIIKYRDLLGGFYSREQLKEVYGLSEDQYMELVKQVYIDTSLLRRMDLNLVVRDSLRKHPYLNVYQADAIIAYREFKGEWENKHEILSNQLLPDSVFQRISPYLIIEN